MVNDRYYKSLEKKIMLLTNFVLSICVICNNKLNKQLYNYVYKSYIIGYRSVLS